MEDTKRLAKVCTDLVSNVQMCLVESVKSSNSSSTNESESTTSGIKWYIRIDILSTDLKWIIQLNDFYLIIQYYVFFFHIGHLMDYGYVLFLTACLPQVQL